MDGKPIPGSPKLKNEDSTSKGWPNFQEIFMVSALTGIKTWKNHISRHNACFFR